MSKGFSDVNLNGLVVLEMIDLLIIHLSLTPVILLKNGITAEFICFP